MRKILPVLFILIISQIAFAQTQIDEYGYIITDDEYFRLANFLEQLKANEDKKGIIVIYKDKREPTGEFLRHFYGVEKFMAEIFGILPDKFSVVFGGEENARRTELWLSKSKKENDKFKSKSLNELVNEKVNKKSLFDVECLDCDRSPFINGYIFREGLVYFAKALQANPRTTALIEISKVKYISKTRKERKELVNKIFEVLVKENKISKSRIKIQFKREGFTLFYIIPQK